MKLLKRAFGILLLTCFFSKVTAQDAEMKTMIQQADSLQRIILKDSLKIDDAIVDKMYAVRNSLKNRIAALKENKTLSAEEKKREKNKARKRAAKELEILLGKKKYKMYRQMIKNRIQKSKSNYREDLE